MVRRPNRGEPPSLLTLSHRDRSLKFYRDVLAHEAEPSRAPNHLPSRHDDGAVTAELHEVDLVCAGTEQNEVRDPEVEHQRPPHADAETLLASLLPEAR